MKIATFQKDVSKASIESVVNSISEDLNYCDSQGVDMACFPECHLTGYHLEKEAIEQNALSLDGPRLRSYLQAWSTFKVTFILGLIEKNDQGYFNAAVVISQGKVLGCYRKTHPNEEHLSAGEDYPIFSKDILFGINICNDANYPDAAKRLATQGAKLLFYPLNNLLRKDVAEKWRAKSPENLQLRAQETGCWVISSDVAGVDGEKMSYGCTQIFSPAGKVLVCVPELKPGFISATITV
jgi:predicted amidohydrolase